MKKYIIIFWILLFSFRFTFADDYCDTLRYAELRAADWQFLWYLTNNSADLNSIACTYWDYWASYSLNSIFTPYWDYWASYQLNSPRCSYCTDAPYIIQWDVYWRLSLNKAVIWQLNPFEVLARCFISPFDKRLEAYKDLDKDNVLLYYQIKACQSDFGTNSTVAEERWKCKCKDWYKRNQNWTSCIPMSEDELCRLEFWNYSYSPEPGKCGCVQWYQWNWNRTSCIKSVNYNNTTSYSTTNNTTITTTVNCDIYWPNAIATTNGQCTCKTDFEWNYNKNWCVADRNNKLYWWKDFRNAKDWGDYINMLLDFEWEIEEKAKAENSTTTSFEKTYKSKSDELKDAIQWMYDNWLTMWNTLPEFLPYDNITREQASKFFVEFAAKVLWKDRWVVYNYDIFSDIKNANPTLKDHIIYANNMWLFKGNNWKFMPFNNLTKAQAIAVLIRLVDWMLDESWTIPYYDVNWDFSEHYWWYTQYLWHATYYKIDKRWITSNIDKLDSDNIIRWDLAILLYEMAMYLSNPDNARL